MSHSIIAQSYNEKPYVLKKFDSNKVKNLKIATSGGGLSVIGTDESEAKLEVYIRANNWSDELDKKEIEERLQNYELVTLQDGNTIIASFKSKDDVITKKRLSVSFKAYVPKNISVNVITNGGSINVVGITGDASGRTLGGSIDISKCNNKMYFKTSGGSINASSCSGNIDLETSGGSITLDTLSGNIKAITSGGSIGATELHGESLLMTEDGSISLSKIYGSLEASTGLGSIDAEILELGKSLTLNASKGNMTIKLPLNNGINLDCSALKIIPNSLTNFIGQFDNSQVKGKLNGGGIPIKLEAKTGVLTLKNL